MSVPDDKVLGSYRLIERIGKGGMGEVFRAQHLKLGRDSAVKVLPVNLAGEADFLKRFEREASSVASLDHPNILPIWEYGEVEGVPYLVMPLVRGGTLKERLEQGPIPLPEITKYLQQMADALDYAHGQGLVHRDVKPANMLMGDRGRLYLSDFGIAKALEGTESLTRTGVGVGTPEYMAPEQAQGRADPRSDLYALGIVLYQMLTGRVPYSGGSAVEILLKHIQEPPPLLPLRNVPSLPPGIERVVEKALAKNPNERYQSGQALAEAFAEAQVSGPGRNFPHPDPGATIAGPLGGLAGEATIRGVTPPPGLQGANQGATVVGGFPTGGGQTPPPQYGQGQGQGATVTGGGFTGGGQTPPPQFGAGPTQVGPGSSSQGSGNTPGFGQTPPPGPYAQGAAATPSPAYGTPAPVAADPRQASPRKSRTPLLLGGLGAAALVGLLACVGLFFALSRAGANTNATATAGVAAAGTGTAGFLAQATGIAGTSAAGTAGANATATAGAPTATPPPPSATPVPPTATTAPTVAATATTAAPVVPVATPTATRLPNTPTTAAAAPTPTRAPNTPTATARPANTPPPTAVAQAPRPNGTVPPNWKVYTGNVNNLPFVMAYPPDWKVEEEEGQVTFTAPNGLSTLFLQSSGVADPSANIDVLRNQYFNETRSTLCRAAGDEGTSRQTRGGIVFAELKASCDYVDASGGNATQFALYIGAGLREGVEWDFTMLTLYPNFDNELRNNYTPMLNTLNIYANPKR